MTDRDLVERKKKSVFECISNAIRSTGRNARAVLRSVWSTFSCVICTTVDIERKEHHYARTMPGSQMAVGRKRSGSSPVSIFTDADAPSRSLTHEYDSLADETLSIRASTLTSPATSPRNTSSIVSYTSVSQSASTSSVTSSNSSGTGVSTAFDRVIELMKVAESTAADTECSKSEMSDTALCPCVSPISFYRSSTTDLRQEDVEETDDAFWDSTAQ